MLTIQATLLVAGAAFVSALDNGMARLPMLGWSSWNAFGCTDAMNETSIKKIADFMQQQGLLDAGYKLIALDDCMVSADRDAKGNLVPDPERFPSGFEALSSYLTSRGFLFGVYSDRGTETCAGRAGGFQHWEADAASYKAWNISWLKWDSCHDPAGYADNTYALNFEMTKALNASGQNVWFYIKQDLRPGGFADMASISNSHRVANDIKPLPADTGRLADTLAPIQKYAGPGSWNDADSLEVGSPKAAGSQYPGLTLMEQKAQMQLFSLAAVPLIAGFDFTITAEEVAILKNKGAIGVNQDSLAVPGERLHVSRTGLGEVWAKPLADGSFAAMLWNRNNTYGHYTKIMGIYLNFAELGFTGKADVYDEWADPPVHLGQFDGVIGNTTLAPQDSMFLRVVPVKGEHFLTGRGFWGEKAIVGSECTGTLKQQFWCQ